MHSMPLGPRRTRVSLLIGLVLAVIMVIVGIVAFAVGGPPWFAVIMLVAGVLVTILAIVRLRALGRS
jgi:ABC-type microcin C transport system permease subunit YejE